MNNTVVMIFIILLGFAMGSFSACMGYRIPNKISTYKKRSFCPNCKKQLKWYMNIPFISYVMLGGKCAYCKKPISLMYPIIEFTSALLYFLAFELYLNTEPSSIYLFLVAIILSTAFLITSVSDFMYYYVSDRVVFISLIAIVLLKYFYLGADEVVTSLISGVAVFALMMFIKFCGDRVFKKESLGGGDIKLMGLIGITIGFIPSLICLFISSIFGLIFSLFAKSDDKTHIIPFGPFLLFSALLCFYFAEPIKYFIEEILKIVI
jgi:leader peptidase (prepilin peptidase)/N-methyltransferase